MARRLGAEKPYTPLDDSLLCSVLTPTASEADLGEQPDSIREATPTRKTRRPGRQRATRTPLEASVPTESDPDENGQTVEDAFRRQSTGSRRVLSLERHASNERMDATLRLKVATRDKREFEAFTARLGIALDTTLKPSNLLRAMLTVMQNSEPSLNELARREPPLRRPANDDLIAYADFEHRLVRVLDAAIRRSPALR